MTEQSEQQVTFNNDRIEVTIPASIAARYNERAKKLPHEQRLASGTLVQHTIEDIARGLILSEAHAKMDYAAALQQHNDSVCPEDVQRIAFRRLVVQHLKVHTRNSQDIIMRWCSGQRIPQRAMRNVEAAVLHAQGILAPLDDETISSQMMEAVAHHTGPDLRLREKLARIASQRAGDPQNAIDALCEARESAMQVSKMNRHYLESRSTMGDWVIVKKQA